MAKNESLELFHQQVTAIEGAIRQGTVSSSKFGKRRKLKGLPSY